MAKAIAHRFAVGDRVLTREGDCGTVVQLDVRYRRGSHQEVPVCYVKLDHGMTYRPDEAWLAEAQD